MRMVVAGATVIAITVTWIVAMSASGPRSGQVPDPTGLAEYLGVSMAYAALVFQFIVLLIFTPVLAAGLIAEERQYHTLPFLLLADLRSFDIFLAKFLAVFLQAELLILSTLPLLASAAFFGGVSVPTGAVQTLIVSASVPAVCAGTLLCSSYCRSGRQALLLTIAALAGWLFLTLYFDWRFYMENIFCRINVIHAVVAYDLSNRSTDWIVCVMLHLVVAAVAACVVVLRLPKLVYGKKTSVQEQGGARYPWGKGVMLMDRLGQLYAANAGGPDFTQQSQFIRVLAGVVFVMVAFVPVFGWVCAPLVLALHITVSLDSAQRKGVLADILVTPVEEKRLAWAVFHANVNRTLFFLPALIVTEYVTAPFLYPIYGGEETDVLHTFAHGLLPLPFGAARYLCIVAVASYLGTRGRHPLWQALAANLVAAMVAFAIYTPIFLEDKRVFQPTAEDLTRLSLTVALAATLGLAGYGVVVLVAYRRFAQGLWGRFPARRWSRST
jgi:hypothetical protein